MRRRPPAIVAVRAAVAGLFRDEAVRLLGGHVAGEEQAEAYMATLDAGRPPA